MAKKNNTTAAPPIYAHESVISALYARLHAAEKLTDTAEKLLELRAIENQMEDDKEQIDEEMRTRITSGYRSLNRAGEKTTIKAAAIGFPATIAAAILVGIFVAPLAGVILGGIGGLITGIRMSSPLGRIGKTSVVPPEEEIFDCIRSFNYLEKDIHAAQSAILKADLTNTLSGAAKLPEVFAAYPEVREAFTAAAAAKQLEDAKKAQDSTPAVPPAPNNADNPKNQP